MPKTSITTAAANTNKANPVNGIFKRLADAGICPVITSDGMMAWAVSMVKAKVSTNGT